MTADVGDPDDVAALHAEVMERTGRIDALVNNAAIVPFTRWDDVDFAEWKRIIHVRPRRGVPDVPGLVNRRCANGATDGSSISPRTLFLPARRTWPPTYAAKGGVIGFTRALCHRARCVRHYCKRRQSRARRL